MLDIAVIIPELSRYGGAQRFVMECVARWQHAHDVTLYSASFNQDLLEEHGISDRVRLKGISPLTEGPHALLYNCTVLPKKWALEIGKHDVYQAHLWPTHLIDLHPMVWYAHEPLRVLYDLCGWDRPIPVHAASDLKTTAERHSPISRAQYCGPGPDSQVLCGSVAGWSGFDDPVRGQVAALPMTYSAPRQSFVPLDVLGRYARVFRGFDEEFRRAEGSVTGWSGLGDPVRGQVAALPTTYSAPRQSFMPLDVLGRYAREIRRVAGNSRFGGRGGRSSGLPAEKYLEFAWEEKWSTDYREFLRMMHAVDRLGQVERCVANSEYTAKYLEDVYGRGCDGVVYPGVTAAEFECGPEMAVKDEAVSAETKRDDYFLTIGQLCPHKRIDLTIQAVARTRNAKLCVAGHGPEKERLQRVAKDLGVQDRVTFLDGLNNGDLRKALVRSSGVIFTPVREPFGIVALEAMAAGKPLIGVDEGGFTELVDDSSGCLVPPDAEALAKKMSFVSDNPQIALNMGKAARHKARKHSWEKTATELLHIVEDAYEAWPSTLAGREGC